MNPFLLWLESTTFSTWMRESPSLFAFPGILAVHTVGMGLVAGINAAVALRILGLAPGVPLAEMRRFFPVMWLGFWLNLASGVALLIGYPTKAVTNPVFYAKLILIAAAVCLVRPVEREMVRSGVASAGVMPASARMLAWASLACWGLAITAGRLLAYTYTRLMAGV
jgi:hypothetical protein